jgi:hypothetical protein
MERLEVMSENREPGTVNLNPELRTRNPEPA